MRSTGSTSQTSGLIGKPIVDLLVGSLEEGRAVTPWLVALGYEDFGEVFISGRLYLRRRGPPHFNIAIAEEIGSLLPEAPSGGGEECR